MLSDPDAGPQRTARFDGTYFGAMKCDAIDISRGNSHWARPDGEPMRVTIRGGHGDMVQGLPGSEIRWSGGLDRRRLEFSVLDDGQVRAFGMTAPAEAVNSLD